MTDVATRLRLAREAAGFSTASEAAERFGWNYPTYAGHENGSRGLRMDVIRRYALAFRVEPSWLIDGSGSIRKQTAAAPASGATRPPGMGERDIAPFRAATPADGRGIDAVVGTMAAGWRHLETWVANRDWHAYAVLRGDIVIVGTPPTGASGDVVIANWADPDSLTTLAQRSGDNVTLPPGEPLPDGAPAILGTMAMVIRPPRKRT